MHFEQAGDSEKAIDYYAAGGQHALKQNAIQEAFGAFDQAAGLIDRTAAAPGAVAEITGAPATSHRGEARPGTGRLQLPVRRRRAVIARGDRDGGGGPGRPRAHGPRAHAHRARSAPVGRAAHRAHGRPVPCAHRGDRARARRPVDPRHAPRLRRTEPGLQRAGSRGRRGPREGRAADAATAGLDRCRVRSRRAWRWATRRSASSTRPTRPRRMPRSLPRMAT